MDTIKGTSRDKLIGSRARGALCLLGKKTGKLFTRTHVNLIDMQENEEQEYQRLSNQIMDVENYIKALSRALRSLADPMREYAFARDNNRVKESIKLEIRRLYTLKRNLTHKIGKL